MKLGRIRGARGNAQKSSSRTRGSITLTLWASVTAAWARRVRTTPPIADLMHARTAGTPPSRPHFLAGWVVRDGVARRAVEACTQPRLVAAIIVNEPLVMSEPWKESWRRLKLLDAIMVNEPEVKSAPVKLSLRRRSSCFSAS